MSKVAIYTRPDGNVSVMQFPGAADEDEARALAAIAAPGAVLTFIERDELPPSRTWREAWRCEGQGAPRVDLDAARPIAHERRRAIRAAQFAPYDEAIAKQIPGTDVAAAEAARARIRERNAQAQTQIDAAPSVDALDAALTFAQGAA